MANNLYNLQEWRKEQGNLYKQMKDLNEKASKENRGMNTEEEASWDKMDARVQELRGMISRTEKLEQEAKDIASEERQVIEESKGKKEIDPKIAFRKALHFGGAALSKDEIVALRNVGIGKEFRGTSDQITTTDSLGGFTVPEFWYDELIKYMTYYSGILECAHIIRTNSGGQMNFPYVNDTSNAGALIGEGVADVVLDLTFANKQLDAYTLTSKWVKVSLELLNDSNYDLGAEVRNLLAQRLGRAINTYGTTGTGSSQPNGAATASTLGKTAAGTGAVTRDEILDLIHSVDRAYRGGPDAKIMMHDSTLAAIRKLTVGTADDRPLWQPDIRLGSPGTLEGVPIVVNNDLGELSDGAATKVMIYGDWSKFKVRLVNDFELIRAQERFIDERVIGFNSFVRFDSELVDTTALKHLITAAS